MTHTTTKKTDVVLALDPGLRDLGYVVLSRRTLLTEGVISLRYVPTSRRLQTIQGALVQIIRGYRPRTLALEHIPRRPLDTLAGLPALGRRLRRLAARSHLKFATYSARAVRRTVAGDGWAGKREVAEALCGTFPQLRVYLTHDRKWKVAYWQNMFDAAAVGVHHQLVSKPPSRSR